jgi:hypothetical protein
VTAENWDLGVPAAQDSALIVSTASPYMPALVGAVTISSVTINSTATLTLNGNSLTLSSFTNAGTLVLVGTETVTTAPNNLAGSTVTYNSAGTSIVLSTWVYRNLQINNANGVFSVVVGSLTVKENLTLTAGTLDDTGGNFTIGVSSNWANIGGVFKAGTSTVTFMGSTAGLTIRSKGSPFGFVQINGVGGGYFTLLDSMTVTSTMTITQGTLDASNANLGVAVGGSWLNNGGAFEPQASTVTFTTPSAGTQTITSGNSNFGSVQFNGPGGYWTLGSSLTVTSTMTLTKGTLDTSASGNQAILLGGFWTNNGGIFKSNGSTITFNGSAAQKFTELSTTTFAVLVDSNTSVGGVTFASSFTATGLWINANGLNNATTVYFNAGSTFTITNLTLNGTSGGKIVYIRPTPANQTWYLNNTSTNTASYVDVAYSSASAGVTITAGPNSTDSGNNQNWTFVILSINLSPNSYDFGSVQVTGSSVSASAIAVTNGGNVTETYSLSVATTGAKTVWGVGTSTPTTYNQFVLEGMFNSARPSSTTFTSQDVISTTTVTSTTSIYAGDHKGLNTPIGSQENFWMLLFMPLSVNTTDQETMTLTVTAGSP